MFIGRLLIQDFISLCVIIFLFWLIMYESLEREHDERQTLEVMGPDLLPSSH